MINKDNLTLNTDDLSHEERVEALYNNFKETWDGDFEHPNRIAISNCLVLMEKIEFSCFKKIFPSHDENGIGGLCLHYKTDNDEYLIVCMNDSRTLFDVKNFDINESRYEDLSEENKLKRIDLIKTRHELGLE